MADSNLRALERTDWTLATLAYTSALALARAEGVVLDPDETLHRLGATPAGTLCGIWARDVWTIDCPFGRWLAQPWRQPIEAARLCPDCLCAEALQD